MALIIESGSMMANASGTDTVLRMFGPLIYEEWNRLKYQNISLQDFQRHLFQAKKFANASITIKDDFFQACFNERWNQNNILDLSSYDLCFAEFNSFLEFLYTGETKISQSNVICLYKVSNMFLADVFRNTLEAYIMENLVNDFSVLTLYQTVADILPTGTLVTRLTEYIRERGNLMMNKPEMLDLRLPLLQSLFAEPMLNVTSTMFFRFCLKWAEKTFRAEPNLSHKFQELDRLFQVDFKGLDHYSGCNKQIVKTDFPVLSDLLCLQDTTFEDQGPAIYTVHRFKDTSVTKMTYRKNRYDKIRFSKDILLKSIGLYGDFRFGLSLPGLPNDVQPATFKVSIKIFCETNPSSNFFSVEDYQGSTSRNRKIFHVGLTPSLRLNSDVWYTIAVQIWGNFPTWRGMQGVASRVILCGYSPLLVEFKDAFEDKFNVFFSNGTGLTVGQIPELSFRIADPSTNDSDIQII